MDDKDFRHWSKAAAEWGADYRATIRDRRVRPPLTPGSVGAQIGAAPPEAGEAMEHIFADFENIIMPAMTHWQHPRFFAYFPANAAPASVVAEYLVTAVAAQCMLWQTSPAATELETRMVDWFRQALGLPERFLGSIQDSASSATLNAVLVMREKALEFTGNTKGLAGQATLRVYCSGEVHTSVDRAIWVSGIGQDNLVRIPVVGRQRSMDIAALEQTIRADLADGKVPAGIIASVGGTSVGGTDDLAGIAGMLDRLERETGTRPFLHVDAAWAGSAMICPELRTIWAGVEHADSIVFNPHKWLGAQFDCSIQFIARPDELVKTLAAQPEYLKTHGADQIVNYSEWSVPLGRRFRALKIWFLLRAYGLEHLRAMIRNHIAWSKKVAERIRALPDFVIVTEPMLSLFSFRHEPAGVTDLDQHNQDLVNRINDDGRTYLTQTRVDGRLAIRFQAGQFDMREDDADVAFEVIRELAARA